MRTGKAYPCQNHEERALQRAVGGLSQVIRLSRPNINQGDRRHPQPRPQGRRRTTGAQPFSFIRTIPSAPE
jgi:hypothetical protein